MDNELRDKYPGIGPSLVPPFERSCIQGVYRYPALVLAQRGSVVLFAAGDTQQFGVGLLDSEGQVLEPDQYPSFEMAARVFLLHAPAA